METTKESKIIYFRRIMQDKTKEKIVRENARRELLKLLDK